jgi:hypothetical protein
MSVALTIAEQQRPIFGPQAVRLLDRGNGEPHGAAHEHCRAVISALRSASRSVIGVLPRGRPWAKTLFDVGQGRLVLVGRVYKNGRTTKSRENEP